MSTSSLDPDALDGVLSAPAVPKAAPVPLVAPTSAVVPEPTVLSEGDAPVPSSGGRGLWLGAGGLLLVAAGAALLLSSGPTTHPADAVDVAATAPAAAVAAPVVAAPAIAEPVEAIPSPAAETPPSPPPIAPSAPERLGLVSFDFNASRAVLPAGLVAAASSCDHVVVVGHADGWGPTEANDAVSWSRARHVAEALTSAGVSVSAIEGHGAAEPAGDLSTREGRAASRRADVWCDPAR